MNFQKVPEGRPLRMAVIGAGNRANKYLEYARRHPERLQPVAVVDGNELRRNETAERFGLASERRYADYDAFFARPADADAVLITTPDDVHFDPCMKAIDAGLHVLLEKPIAQRLDECRAIARRARERGVLVGICHVLRYHPYFAKIREIVDSGELGQIISVNHVAAVGIDRTTHSYVRGPWRREETSNPMLLAKCCHDVDFLLWITRSPCRKLSSFGSLRWFRAANAPQTSAERCIDCPVEHDCPYSAVDLYCTRRDWISNFDVPQGRTLDEVLLEDCRRTHIKMTHGEIFGDERKLHVHRFRRGHNRVYDFEELAGHPFHAGADLRLIEDFVDALTRPGHPFLCTIEDSIESHRICFEAERSRRCGETIRLE